LNELKKYYAFIAISVVLIIGAFFIGTQVNSSDSKESKKSEEVKAKSSKDSENKMEETSTQMTTAPKMGSAPAMKEESLKLDSSLPTPAVALKVEKDAIKGYNLVVTTKDFEFKPENVNQAEGKTPQNEGHAHIYINGVKLTRLYAKNYYLSVDAVKPGDKVTVSINTNKHRTIASSNEVEIS